MTLIERLKLAAGPDRDLDVEIAKAINDAPLRRLQIWKAFVPHYTGSVDAALTLIAKDDNVKWTLYCSARWPGRGQYHAMVFVSGAGWVEDSPQDRNVSTAATPALALCISALRERGLK